MVGVAHTGGPPRSTGTNPELRARTERVFAFLHELLDELPTDPSHRRLLRVHLAEGREQVDDAPYFAAVDLPLLTYAAIAGDGDRAVPVAAACTLVYLGADLLDNVADDELPARWREWGSGQATLAGATVLAVLPGLALRRAGARAEAIERELATTLLTMSAGQHADLAVSGRDDVSPATARGIAEREGGMQIAFFARAGAMLATDDAETARRYGEFGFCLGTAGQIASDAADLWSGEEGHDLRTGKRTLPIAHALARLRGAERARLAELLAQAKASPDADGEILDMLVSAGSLRYTALVVEVYSQRARRALAAASPREGPERELSRILDHVSFVR